MGRVLVERAQAEAADFSAEAASRPRAPGEDHHTTDEGVRSGR
jgi:hypothetical protein